MMVDRIVLTFIAIATLGRIYNVQCYMERSFSISNKRAMGSTFILESVPKDITFDAGQVEIIRMIGKIDVQIDKQTIEESRKEMERSGGNGKQINELNQFNNALSSSGSATSVRVFEARITGGTKCFLKEFLPVGLSFGRRELLTTRKLVSKWNELDPPIEKTPPFPVLLGSLKTDERVEDPEFRNRWIQSFPKTKPPGAGNLWLIYKWDKSSFKSLKTFPPLPQVVEGLDYFRKDERINKRWRFIRKIMRSGLETVDFVHRSGYCHNAVSSESMWMSTTNQQSMDELGLSITDLGTCQKFSELGPQGAREGTILDMYQLGFVFLELIFSSFSDDNLGAEKARGILDGTNSLGMNYLALVRERNLRQLSQREMRRIFEEICDSDFKTVRLFMSSIENWKDAVSVLEMNDGAAWKLIFKLLAKGRLYDNDKEKPLQITGNGLVRENKVLFADTYS